MPKIRFENGTVVNFDGNPTQQDIDEIASKIGVNQPQPQNEPGGVVGALKKGWEDLKTDFTKREDNTGKAMNANQSGLSKTLQVLGQGFGLVGDVAGNAIGTTVSAITPDEVEKQVKDALGKGVNQILQTAPVKKGIEKYQGFKEAHPEAAGNVEAVANILDTLALAAGAGEAKKGAETAAKSAFKAGVEGIEKAGSMATKAGENAGSFADKIANITKKIGSEAKEKFAESKIGEKVADVVSPMDNNVKKTIDPLASVPKENIPNIPKEVIDKVKEATSGRMEFYLNKARRAVQNPSLPTPLEFAGKKAEEALSKIGNKIAKYGQQKKVETEALKDSIIQGVPEIKTKLMDSLGEIAGVDINDAGEFVAKAGRSVAVSDPSDLKLIKTIKNKLDSLGESPTFKQVDDAVDYMQDLLYKKKANLAQPINSKIEGVVKKITGELNGKLKSSGTQLYRDSNQSISRLMEVRDNLNKALGYDANKGGSLMKRVFSPTDGGTKKMFNEIKKITGIDLNEEATLAKFAMENFGDARQANLLEQLELIKGAVGAKGSFLADAIKRVAERAGKAAVGDQVERARRILRK